MSGYLNKIQNTESEKTTRAKYPNYERNSKKPVSFCKQGYVTDVSHR